MARLTWRVRAQALRLFPANHQARRFLELASELDLESRVTNFFILHQHDSDMEKMMAAANDLATEQVAIGRRALQAAEDTSHLIVAAEYFKAALRLSPTDEQAAAAMEEVSRRLFEARERTKAMAPPYRTDTPVNVHGVRITRGITQSERGSLYVAYEVLCTHSQGESPTVASASAKSMVPSNVVSTEAIVMGHAPGLDDGWSTGADGVCINVYSMPSSAGEVMGTLWHGDRVTVLEGPGRSMASPTALTRWRRVQEDGRWTSSPSGDSWILADTLRYATDAKELARNSEQLDCGAVAVAPTTRGLLEAEQGRRKHVVYCRYSAFESLRRLLAGALPQGAAGLPSLPRKTLGFRGDRDFVERRRRELEQFLHALLEPVEHGFAGPTPRHLWGVPPLLLSLTSRKSSCARNHFSATSPKLEFSATSPKLEFSATLI